MAEDKVSADRFEILKFISETNREQHSQRRHYEARYFLAILTFYVLFMYVLNSTAVEDLPRWYYLAGFSLFLIAAPMAISVFYLRHLHLRNHANIERAATAENFIMDSVDESAEVFVRNKKKEEERGRWFLKLDRSFVVQLLTIGVFAVAASGVTLIKIMDPKRTEVPEERKITMPALTAPQLSKFGQTGECPKCNQNSLRFMRSTAQTNSVEIQYECLKCKTPVLANYDLTSAKTP